MTLSARSADIPQGCLRSGRPGQGKTDPVDAVAIARITARERDLPPVRLAVGSAADLRAMADYRRQLTDERTALANRTHSELRGLHCTGKVGVIGFCMGGAFALVASTHGFDVASANYGALPSNIDNRFEGACPIIGSYGGKDRLLPKKTTEKLGKALTAAGVEHDVRAYPGAGHQFLNDAKNGPLVLRPLLKVTNAGPNPAAAAQAWERIEAYFGQYLR